jgi:hypothetical protein
VLQKPLAGSDWFILVNSGAVWLTIAFLVGLLVPSRLWVAAAAGGVTEAGLVIGYYATASLRGYAVSSGSVTGWVLTGLVGGPLVAAAAASLRDERLPLRIAATSLLGGIWIEEGIHILQFTEESSYGAAGWYEIAFGVMLPLVLGRSAKDRLLGLLALPLVALAAYVFTGPVLESLLGSI